VEPFATAPAQDRGRRAGERAERTRSGRQRGWPAVPLLLGLLAGVALWCVPVRAEERKDDPAGALAYNLLLLKNEDGVIPRGALLNAVRQTNAMRLQVGLRAKVAGLPVGTQIESKDLTPKVGGLTAGGWKWLGPGNIGGRVTVLLPHPRDPGILYAGTASGGVWKTTNGGKEWSVLADFPAVAVSCLVVDPTNPDVLYAGTGDVWLSGPERVIRGEGVLKSTDGGSTWKQVEGTAGDDFAYVGRLAISPDGKVLLAATPKGLFRRDGEARSWTQVKKIGILDVRFHPTDGRLCIAGTLMGKAFYSTDGGATWESAKGLPTFQQKWEGRVELTYARADPNIVYASVDHTQKPVDDGAQGEVYRSTDGGKTYQLQSGEARHLGRQGVYANTVWAGDPTSADHVVVGGLDLWRSTDGGKTFTQISIWQIAPNSAHADQHWIVADPRYDGKDNTILYFGNDGGVYKTDDITTVNPVKGWQALNNNFGATQFYGAAVDPAGETILGGTQDNGTLRFTRGRGPQKWSEVKRGDGGVCAADPTDPKCFYGEYVYLTLYRSTDGGIVFREIWEGIEDKKTHEANFIAPFVLDPNAPQTLLAGGKSLWRSTDAKADKQPSWKAIKPPIQVVGNREDGFISALAVAKGSSDTIWVGYNNGSLFKTGNGTADSPTWERLDKGESPKLPRLRICTRIVIDPRDARRVFVTFGGYAPNNLWLTEDGGSNWTSLPIRAKDTPPLSAPVFDLAIHPANPKCLYAATQVGVFASEDGGQLWSPTNEGPTNSPVQQLLWMDKTLLAVTHGRGMYEIDLSGVRPARERP
jgi:photosystem II stability/assembly factor-like uncharacterized protein